MPYTERVIIPVGTAQVTWLFTGACVPLGAAVTMGFDTNGSTSPLGYAQDLRDAWSNEMFSQLHSSLQLSATHVKFGPNSVGPAAVQGGGGNGGNGGDPSPPNLAYLARKVTSLGGRKQRGRFFIPGCVDGDVDAGGVIDSTVVTALAGDLAGLHAAMVAADAPPLLLHSDNTTPTAIDAFVIQSVAATQRRRMRR